MILPIVKIGTPLLRHQCKAVSPSQLKSKYMGQFLKDMTATMCRANGVGLAANQVGINLNVLVMESKNSRRYPTASAFGLQFYLNTKIVSRSKKMEKGWEGCLSIPGYRGLVPRHSSLTFTALTPDGQRVQKTVKGFEARVIQHEVDHLNGLFYMDRMADLREWFHLDLFNDKVRKDKVRKDKVRKDKVRKDKVRKDKVRKDKVRKDKVRKDKVRKDKVRKGKVRQKVRDSKK